MDITIRPAIMSDVTQIASLTKQLGYENAEADINNRMLLLLRCETDVVFVATSSDMIIGWIQMSHILRLESGYFCEITGLVVEETYRSMGVGHQFIGFAKKWCKQKGCNKLRVRTNVKRLRTHKFYEHAGFVLVKEQKVYEMEI